MSGQTLLDVLYSSLTMRENKQLYVIRESQDSSRITFWKFDSPQEVFLVRYCYSLASIRVSGMLVYHFILLAGTRITCTFEYYWKVPSPQYLIKLMLLLCHLTLCDHTRLDSIMII